MNTTGINQVLAQMRVMESQLNVVEPLSQTSQSAKGSFSDLLTDSINAVNDNQMKAKEMTTAFTAGEPGVDLPEVMVALQKSSVSFQAVTQVRNQLLSAYQEVMNMQV